MIKNEKGSFFIVLGLIIIAGIVVVALSRYMLSAQITARNITESQIKSFYREDEAIEVSKNLILQKLMSKEWKSIRTNDYVLSKSEMVQIENYINDVVMVEFGKESVVTLSLRDEIPVKRFCAAIYEENVFGDDYFSEDENEFVEFKCNTNSIDIKYDINISSKGSDKMYAINIEDFELKTIKNKQAFAISKSNIYTYVQ